MYFCPKRLRPLFELRNNYASSKRSKLVQRVHSVFQRDLLEGFLRSAANNKKGGASYAD